ncbi:Heterokaryon incompatibility protein (HET) domain containing protein [Hyaloscypha variabilis]
MIRMTSTTTPYNYRPLSNPSAIRLIKIRPDCEYNRVRCTIHHFDNTYVSGLRYHALSYVWGNPYPARRICIGDTPDAMHRYPIHESIWEFLTKLWEGKYFDCYFWTDTLCLNQKDISEINQQVARMGDIYSAAEEVVSWISDGASHPGRQRRGSGTFNLHDDPSYVPHPNFVADNAYWGRVWIMQEVVPAKKGRVLCGNMSIDLDHLFSLLDDPTESIATIQSLRKSPNRKIRLWELLKGFKYIQSTQPVDKIYGILGLIEDEESQPSTAQVIGVDYQKKLNEVFWDLVFECQHRVSPREHSRLIEIVDTFFPASTTIRDESSYADFQILEAYHKEARTSELHASYAAIALRVYNASLIFVHVLTSLKNWPHLSYRKFKRDFPCKTKVQSAAYVGFELTVGLSPKDVQKWDAHKQLAEGAELSKLTSWRCGAHYDRDCNLIIIPENLKPNSDGSIKLNQKNIFQIWDKLLSSCDASHPFQYPEDCKSFPRVCEKFSPTCDGSMMVFNMPDVGFRLVILSMGALPEIFIDLD